MLAGIMVCITEECEKSKSCFRYKNSIQGSESLDFKHICNETNEFARYWRMNVEEVPVEVAETTD